MDIDSASRLVCIRRPFGTLLFHEHGPGHHPKGLPLANDTERSR